MQILHLMVTVLLYHNNWCTPEIRTLTFEEKIVKRGRKWSSKMYIYKHMYKSLFIYMTVLSKYRNNGYRLFCIVVLIRDTDFNVNYQKWLNIAVCLQSPYFLHLLQMEDQCDIKITYISSYTHDITILWFPHTFGESK